MAIVQTECLAKAPTLYRMERAPGQTKVTTRTHKAATMVTAQTECLVREEEGAKEELPKPTVRSTRVSVTITKQEFSFSLLRIRQTLPQDAHVLR